MQILARQIAGVNSKDLVQLFQTVTSNNPFSYLLLNTTQTCKDNLRITSNIFPSEWPMKVYVPT